MWAIRLLWARKSAVVATQVLASLIAIVVLPLTYVAGHTGAESVWKEDYAKAQEPISRESVTFSMDEVAKRNTAEQCWTVVNDVVYNMTTFIKRHPAGSKDIIDMCGKDASDDFLGEHEGQGEPEKWLETLKIGALQK
jgi:cytochrome b involved in lipid metabolism